NQAMLAASLDRVVEDAVNSVGRNDGPDRGPRPATGPVRVPPTGRHARPVDEPDGSTGSSPYSGSTGSSPYSGSTGSSPYTGSTGSSPYSGSTGSTPRDGRED
ncbi:hypothetical protein ACFWIF_06175, partial [Corynebacterium bovis]